MISRRDLLKVSGLAALTRSFPSFAASSVAPDYRIDIAPVTLDLSPRHAFQTTAYSGRAPGAVLRLKENEPVTIEVANHTDRPEVVHWHGLFTPSDVDGAIEEGTPTIAS